MKMSISRILPGNIHLKGRDEVQVVGVLVLLAVLVALVLVASPRRYDRRCAKALLMTQLLVVELSAENQPKSVTHPSFPAIRHGKDLTPALGTAEDAAWCLSWYGFSC